MYTLKKNKDYLVRFFRCGVAGDVQKHRDKEEDE